MKFSTEYVDEYGMLFRRPGFPTGKKPAWKTLQSLCWNKLCYVIEMFGESMWCSWSPFTFLS